MKKKTAGILLGIVVSAAFLAGCAKNEATEAANESAETEKEGNGEDAETEAAHKEEKTETEEIVETEPEVPAKKVGVLLPDEEQERWSRDGAVMKETLVEAGYETQILYAGDDASTQVSQIEGLIDEEVSALIVTPVDAYSLVEVLAGAKEKSIPVFSYDRLVMDTDAVSYYTTFNTREIGQLIGNTIVDEMGLEKARESKQSCTIEFLMGSPDDGAALFLYNGVMEVLQSYLDDGTLVCKSQRTSFDDTGILRWSQATAKTELSQILTEFYSEGDSVDIVCTSYDGFASAALSALEESGLTPGGDGWPMITGVGCEAAAVKNVAEGKQDFSVFLDSRELAAACVKMVDTYLTGEKPEVKDYEQYDNGKKIIGTYTLDVQLIDQDNYQLLIDNGYYEKGQIEPEATPTPTPEPTPEPTPTAEPTATPEPTPEPTVTEAPKSTDSEESDKSNDKEQEEKSKTAAV